jgi:hypothetical protein
MFTLDGNRGFSFNKRNDRFEASLIVRWRKEPQREAAIRSFFKERNIAPTEDRLSGFGPLLNYDRLLNYPVTGDAAEVTELTKAILLKSCQVSLEDGLQIKYKDYK